MLPETIELSTDRLLLKEVTPASKVYILSKYSDEDIMSYMGMNTNAELEKEKNKLKKNLTSYQITFKYFLLIYKETNKTIGSCGYFRWYKDHDRAEIGYSLTDDSYKKKGLMTEATREILKYGFGNMNLHRVEAFAHPENIASVKILEGLGFQYEGLLREHYLTDGNYEDSACYGLLKHEFYNPE